MQSQWMTAEVLTPQGTTILTTWPSGAEEFDERLAHLFGKFQLMVERAGGRIGACYLAD